METPNQNQEANARPKDLLLAIADLRRAEGLLMIEIAGSSKWIEIVLFILRMISYILEKLPLGDKLTKQELAANQAQLTLLQNSMAAIAKLKSSAYPINRGGPCGETKV